MANMSSGVHVGIALYFVRPTAWSPAYFHWALVVKSSETDWSHPPLIALELKRNESGDFEQSAERFNVTSSGTFTGIVHLFTTDSYTADGFKGYVLSHYPAWDNKWRLPGPYGPPNGWTCATWILHILVSLQEDGVWSSTVHVENMYVQVLNLGADMLDTLTGREGSDPQVVPFK